MKKLISMLLLFGMGSSSWAAVVTYTRVATGSWTNLAQWKDNATGSFVFSTVLPGAADLVVINNNLSLTANADATVGTLQVVNNATAGTLTMNSANTLSAGVLQVGVTSTGTGIVNQTAGTISAITTTVGRATGNVGTYNLSGGKLDVKSTLTVSATGLVDVKGGTLSLSGGGTHTISGVGTIKLSSGLFEIDASMANTNVLNFTPGLFDVSGGTNNLDAVVRVGSLTAQTEFRVVGDAATINISKLQQASSVTTNGVFHFIFNATGISTINSSIFQTMDGAKIVVDGSAYTGPDGTFTLFDSPNLSSLVDTNNITITGFGSKTVSIVQDQSAGKDWVQLVVVSPVRSLSLVIIQ
ncbi:MAG: hypothetical protein HOO88_08570 [Kiritimatiellaceae bacterium]|nr:hypothetical protein [Kiritimatiellaceae bacterium]